MLQGNWTLPPITPDTKVMLSLCLIIMVMLMILMIIMVILAFRQIPTMTKSYYDVDHDDDEEVEVVGGSTR